MKKMQNQLKLRIILETSIKIFKKLEAKKYEKRNFTRKFKRN